MGILDILREDHQKVLDLLEKLEESSDRAGKTRQHDFMKVKKEILEHMYGEEAVFYPYLLENGSDRQMVLEAIEEHQAVKMALPGIEQTDVGDEHWKPKLKVMAEMVRHHIDEEESEVFEMAEETMDDAANSRLAKDFQQAKKSAEVKV